MAPISIDDLIASLKSNGIGQEANDIAAVKAHLNKTLGDNGYTPSHTSNTPQGTPVTMNPPMGAPWDTRARRRRSQSRGLDVAIDEEDEAMNDGMDRWRSSTRGSKPEVGNYLPPAAPSAPLSPPASPTRPQYAQNGCIPPMAILQPTSGQYHTQPPYPHDSYAASADPFLGGQQAGAPFYNPFFPQSPPTEHSYAPPPVPWGAAAPPAWAPTHPAHQQQQVWPDPTRR